MAEIKSEDISRDKLADLLNEDLVREYQAIIACVVYCLAGGPGIFLTGKGILTIVRPASETCAIALQP